MKNKNIPICSTDHPEFDKYRYLIKYPKLLKFIYIFGIASWLTSYVSYFSFFNQDLMYWALFFPPLTILTIYYVISYSINLAYTKPSIDDHESLVQEFTKSKDKPTVDVFLPVCGESIEIIKRTWEAVSKLDYKKLTVYVLDDKNIPELKTLAESYGFVYYSRPNRGHMKKAGNLKYGFENSSGDYFIIFDADFAPLPSFVNETVPYMIKDTKIGILQTPQYFEVNKDVNTRSMLEYGAGAIQEDFYRLIQPARNNLGGAICVGTCAIYRRSALNKIGGTHQIEHSEDVWTGVMVTLAGYKVWYSPIILSQGYCPDDSEAFFKQQYRWCAGSMSLMTNPIFWKLKISWLSRMCFVSGFMYYITSFFNYLFPLIGIFLIANNIQNLNLLYVVPFLPYIFFTYVLLPFFRIHNRAVGNTISRMIAMSAYSLALIHTMTGWNLGWTPTGAKSKRDFWITFSYLSSIFYFGAYIAINLKFLLSGTITFYDPNHLTVLVWVLINIFSHTIFLLIMSHDMHLKNLLDFHKIDIHPTVFVRAHKGFAVVFTVAMIGFFLFFSRAVTAPTVENTKLQPIDSQFLSTSISSTNNNSKTTSSVATNKNAIAANSLAIK